MSHAPAPVPASVIDDLRARLRATRRVALAEGVGWSRGVDADYLSDLVSYWATAYAWPGHEARLLDLPWAYVGEPGSGLRLIHARSGSDAPTVVLLHGWPDSFLRFTRVLPRLRDLNVVVPCLPGFPYADPLTTPGMTRPAMAERVAAAMDGLGYQRYVVSGGDIGGSVAEALARARPAAVAALHLTDIPLRHLSSVAAADLSEKERDYVAAAQRWQLAEGAYALEQSTKPHTLAVGLGDSPAGLLAWILEKLRSWSDCGGDVESVLPRDDLLTWVTLYWVTGTIGSSFTPYVERTPPKPAAGRLETPTVVSTFPHDLLNAPREFGERVFDIRAWDEHPRGGHFAAWECPDEFVAGVRKAVDLTRHHPSN